MSAVGLPTKLGVPSVRAPAQPGYPCPTAHLLTYPNAQHWLAINTAVLGPPGSQWMGAGWHRQLKDVLCNRQLPRLGPYLSLCPHDWRVWAWRSVCGLWQVENLHSRWERTLKWHWIFVWAPLPKVTGLNKYSKLILLSVKKSDFILLFSISSAIDVFLREKSNNKTQVMFCFKKLGLRGAIVQLLSGTSLYFLRENKSQLKDCYSFSA